MSPMSCPPVEAGRLPSTLPPSTSRAQACDRAPGPVLRRVNGMHLGKSGDGLPSVARGHQYVTYVIIRIVQMDRDSEDGDRALRLSGVTQ
jgi:hypothetical protein